MRHNSITLYSIGVAYKLQGVWRLRYRLVVTRESGILCFPLYTTFNNANGVYSIPDRFNLNTALIIGIETTDELSVVDVRIYANQTGVLNFTNATNFNGYEGQITFDSILDKTLISDSFKPRRYSTLRFDRALYQNRLENLASQWCENCATEAFGMKNFRKDLYAKVPVVTFTMDIECEEDVVYLLNKMDMQFEEVTDEQADLHAHVIDGVFRVKKHSVEFKATSIKKFEIIVTFGSTGEFRPRIRVLIDGETICCARCDDYDINGHNTAIVLGIVSANDPSFIKMSSNNISGGVTYWNASDAVYIDDELKAPNAVDTILDALSEVDSMSNDSSMGKQITDWIIAATFKI